MRRFVFLIPDGVKAPTGGIMNIVRHCTLARQLGADVVLATDSGSDRHSRDWFRHQVPFIPWRERKHEDICVIPDIFTDRVGTVEGPCIVYMQSPVWLRQNFDYTRDNLWIWTDSPIMLRKCQQLYPGKEIPMVPNIVDNDSFPFIPQKVRKEGMIIVFPRKGPDFIKQVFTKYHNIGGKYWKPKVIDRMPFEKMALVFRQAQAFLASADAEGCALPPQESMAAGVVVVGKNANGANYCMQHGQTALVGDTAEVVAKYLCELEMLSIREFLATTAFEFIKQFFPNGQPTQFWQTILSSESWEIRELCSGIQKIQVFRGEIGD